MQAISFENICGQHCAFTDATSVEMLTASKDFIKECLSPDILRKVQRNPKSEPKAAWILDFLGRLVIFDFLVVDTRALDALGVENTPWDEVIRVTSIPVETYNAAFSEICEYGGALLNVEQGSWLKRSIYNYGDKRYVDALERDPDLMTWGLSDSTIPGLRIYLYMVLSADRGVPLVLDPRKDAMIKQLQRDTQGSFLDAFSKIMGRLDEQVVSKIQLFCDQWGKSDPIPLPPLSNYLCGISKKNKISLLDAARYLRETQEAKGFRKWLYQYDTYSRSTTLSDRAKAKKCLEELGNLAEQWVVHSDFNIGVKYQMRTLDLGEFANFPDLKAVSTMLRAFNMDKKIAFRDPILNRQPYKVFLANLFTHERAK